MEINTSQAGGAVPRHEADGAPRFARRAIPPGAVEHWWHAPDGHAIRRFDWEQAGGRAGRQPGEQTQAGSRGRLLFLPGRGDAYEKYLESFGHWHARGWAITALDWRGQAGSGRLGFDAQTGHVADFAVWLNDFGAFWRDWRDASAGGGGADVVVAHSMGGHLALRALAEGRIDPTALVLTTPMLGIGLMPGPGRVPTAWLHRLARTMAARGDPRRPAWRNSEKPGVYAAQRRALLTQDRDRYADEQWWRGVRPELEMGPASWGWLAAALGSIRALFAPGLLGAVTTPVLLFAAERDGLVDSRAIYRAAALLPRGELVRLGRGARHEILRETDAVRDAVLTRIDAFLDRAAPA